MSGIYINDNLAGMFDIFSLLTFFMITFLKNYPVVLLRQTLVGYFIRMSNGFKVCINVFSMWDYKRL